MAAPIATQVAGAPFAIAEGLTFDPIVDVRVRYENVDQPTLEADAITARMRAGFELKQTSGLSFLIEGEGTWAIGDDYNAFPFLRYC